MERNTTTIITMMMKRFNYGEDFMTINLINFCFIYFYYIVFVNVPRLNIERFTQFLYTNLTIFLNPI